MLSGAAAFAAMWRAIPLLRPLGLAARDARVLAVLEWVYLRFLSRPTHAPAAGEPAREPGARGMTVRPDPPAAGQESVWSYPRPAIAEPSSRRIRIVHQGIVIADTGASIRTLETSHPPSYYIPLSDIMPGVLQPSGRRSFCEWKGDATYFDLVVGEREAARCRLELSRSQSGLSLVAGSCGLLCRGAGRVLRGWRTRDAAAGRLLWRMDHVPRCRAVQGCARQPVLVSAEGTCGRSVPPS